MTTTNPKPGRITERTVYYRLAGDNVELVCPETEAVLLTVPNAPGLNGLLYEVWSRGAGGTYLFSWDNEASSTDGIFHQTREKALAHDSATNRGFKGCVLEIGEMNFHDDSDFYAVVWDEAARCVHRIGDGTTRASAPSVCRIDATPETIAKAQAWMVNVWAPPHVRRGIETKRAKVEKGDRVRVNRGRKVAKGTEGVVFFMQEVRFSYHNVQTKIGVATTDRKDARGRFVDVAWTYLANVDKLDIVPTTDAEVAAASLAWADSFRCIGADPRMFLM
jgi:hypothetical protein